MALSLWLSTDSVINKDGILYLQAALAYSEGGLQAAIAAYKWPFYSVCIALVQKVTQLSFQHAAYLINAFLCILIVTGFINLVKALGGRLQVQVFAAIVILLHTGLNDYRDYIIRDLGHWAFMLYGLYFLICYAQRRQLRFAFMFGASMLVAFLFRTEAIFVMLFAPLALLLPVDKLHFLQRARITLGAYSLFILLGLAACIAYLVGEPHLAELPLSNPWIKHLIRIDYTQAIVTQIDQLRPAISSNIPDSQLPYVMLGGFISYFLVRLCALLSPLYTLLTGYAFYQHLIKPSIARTLLFSYTTIYTLLVLGFLFYRFFLSGRYVMPIVLLLSLMAPFALSALYDTWRARKKGTGKHWGFPLCVVFLVYMLGDSII